MNIDHMDASMTAGRVWQGKYLTQPLNLRLSLSWLVIVTNGEDTPLPRLADNLDLSLDNVTGQFRVWKALGQPGLEQAPTWEALTKNEESLH